SALATFRRAVAANGRQIRPRAAPHASFAIFLLRLDRVQEAAAEVRRALALDPRDELAREAQRALARRADPSAKPAAPRDVFTAHRFENSAAPAGLDLRLENSPTRSKHQIETMAGGVAVLDYDQDSLIDI